MGGIGTPAHEVLNVRSGLPPAASRAAWVTLEDVEWYTGTARDIHGELINPEAADDPEPFLGVAIDPSTRRSTRRRPPTSRRHGLFLRSEERRLPVDAFAPEQVQADAPEEVVA